jgi:8-oxo-dGTP pyrophosphatase MutT (NUDIX family)
MSETTQIEAIHLELASRTRVSIAKPQLKHAGVLIPLFFQQEELCVLLTKRTDFVETHKGQISFPGGTKDESDTSIIDTALRETFEEIGISPRHIDVLGLFDDYETPSGFLLTPVVGYIRSLPQMMINQQEVAEVLSVPLSFFLDAQHHESKKIVYNDCAFDVNFYYYHHYTIWGATATLLKGFCEKILNSH